MSTADTSEVRPYERHWRMNPKTRAILDEAVQAAVEARNGDVIPVVLDVGCGRQSNVVYPGAQRVVGTDVDLEGLAKNETIDVAVPADIVTAELPERSVDAIACIYVLEHVNSPDLVFAKLARALRPHGVMIIAVPNVSAPKAKVTKWTPHFAHKMVYRRLLGRTGAGEGIPFETVLDSAIRPDRLERLAAACGLVVLYRRDFEDNKQRQLREKFHLGGGLWALTRAVFRGASRGRVDPESSDVVFAFQRSDQQMSGALAEALKGHDPGDAA